MDSGDKTDMGGVVSICLGILQVGGLAVAGLMSLFRSRRRRAAKILGFARCEQLLAPPGRLDFRIRAGPEVLQVFRR